jgi:general secretion pathway protein F
MRFEVKAMRPAAGTAVALTLDAVDAADATALARAQGYDVLTVKSKQPWLAWSLQRRSQFPLTLFSQELLALLSAGLTVVDAVATLAEKETRPETKNTLQQIIAALYEGRTLSNAMQRFPAAFPPLYVATVRASERTGDLSEALTRYVSYQSKVDVVRRKIVSASIYPLLLLGAGALVTLFLMGYVVPRFSRIYEDLGTNLPFLSQLLLQWGKLLQAHALVVVVALVAAAAAITYIAIRPASKSWVMHRLWRIPAIDRKSVV